MSDSREKLREAHLWYLKQTNFWGALCPGLSDAERGLLRRQGLWLWALANGELAPLTPAQEEFIQFARGTMQPRILREVAWTKFRDWNQARRRSKIQDEPFQDLEVSLEGLAEDGLRVSGEEKSRDESGNDVLREFSGRAPEGMDASERDWDSEDYE